MKSVKHSLEDCNEATTNSNLRGVLGDEHHCSSPLATHGDSLLERGAIRTQYLKPSPAGVLGAGRMGTHVCPDSSTGRVLALFHREPVIRDLSVSI